MKALSLTSVSALALLLLWIGLTAGCGQSAAVAPSPEPTTVSVSYPVEREVTDYADFTGRTAAVDSVEVRARVDGYLQSVNFKEGTLVKKGDVLFVIDPRPFVAELNRAKAQLEEAKANYTQSIGTTQRSQGPGSASGCGCVLHASGAGALEATCFPEKQLRRKNSTCKNRSSINRRRTCSAPRR